MSTASGLVCAGAGCRVLKHGNRSSSSSCGSADVLEALGANLGLTDSSRINESIEAAGFCFLFAQAFHPAMKQLGAVRKEIGIRTVFNM